MSRPAISIVMPIYNASAYLREAFESVEAQTFDDLQVVCVNDGSTDDSLAIIEKYASKDARFTVVDKPNGGYGQGMNVGIAHATGEYVGILEPDDYLMPTMFETLYRVAKADDLDFVRSDFYRFVTNDGIEVKTREDISDKPEYYGTVLNPQENIDLFNIHMQNWTGIYKRDFLNVHNIRFNESPGASFQDNGFWFQTYCWATRIALVHEPFYCYRNDNESSSINQTNKVFTMLDEYAWMREFLRDNPELEKKFIGIFQYKKMHNCEFAFSRLADEFQPMFLERYAREYREAIDAGEVDSSLFWPEEWERLQQIVQDPEAYCEHYRAEKKWEEERLKAQEGGKIQLFEYYAKSKGLAFAIKKGVKSVLSR